MSKTKVVIPKPKTLISQYPSYRQITRQRVDSLRRQLENQFGEQRVVVTMKRVQTKNMWEVIQAMKNG